jgi:uncharacterized membrane protein
MNDEKKIKLLPVFHILNVILLGLNAGNAIVSWGSLPAKVPVHFGFDGSPNRWADKGAEMIIIFAMPFMITLFLYAIAFLLIPWMVKNHPNGINIPNKEKVMSLPAEKQSLVWNLFGEMFSLIAVCVNALFLYMIYETVETALGITMRMHAVWIFPLMGLLIAVIAGYSVMMVRLVKRLTEG